MHDDEERSDMRRAILAVLPLLLLTRDADAQDAVAVQPRAYKVVFENDKVRVLEYNSKPGMGMCGNGIHSHPAHLTVALTPAKVRVRLPDGTSIVGENKAGDVFWAEAETHETENISGRNARALMIEIKAKA
jgi:beta-alanine degradation protein BauB